jgi:lysozyme
MKKMTTSVLGKSLIKDFEGLRLDAYRCPAGVPTIGYGHTKGVKMGQKITNEQAEDFLIEDIAPIERFLNGMSINFRQEQFDALVSSIFNLGLERFSSSTLFKRIISNASDEEITEQIVKWIYAGGQPLVGLKRRRIAEANMWPGYERYYLDKDNNINKK